MSLEIQGPDIPGVGSVDISVEYTSTAIKDEYEKWMQQLQAVFSHQPLTADDYAKVQEAMDALAKLATSEDTTSPGGPFRITGTMANNIKAIFQILEAAGLTPGKSVDPATGVSDLNTLLNTKIPITGSTDTITFKQILDIAVSQGESEDMTLQEKLNTNVIQAGLKNFNDILKQLQDAIATNQEILDLLEKLQQLRNQTIHPGTGVVMPKPDINDYIKQYGATNGQIKYNADLLLYNAEVAASAGDGKSPSPPNITVDQTTVQSLLQYRQQIKDEIAKLQKLQPSDPTQPNPAQSLIDKLQAINDDLDSCFSRLDELPSDPSTWNQTQKDAYNQIVSHATYQWMIDGQDTTGTTGGAYSTNVANAVTASETLNDNQKDKFNQAEQAFDSFVKIATSLESALNDMIKKFASGIGRQ